MTKQFFRFLLCILLCFSLFAAGCTVKPVQEYGVFLGIRAEQQDRLNAYRMVVIEPSEFSAEQINKLHIAGKTVYGYLNIGAIEEYRPYFDRFQDLTLGVYEGWPEERWIDAAAPVWRDFLVDELGGQYAALGLDGFFLDNADVYYHYPTDDIFQGLCAILQGLRRYDLPFIINGGDSFVSRCMEEGVAPPLFEGINQETVFTSVDFESGAYGEQTEAETAYFQDYLSTAKAHGLSVYLLEYRADRTTADRIDAYCTENGFLWYNADGIELR